MTKEKIDYKFLESEIELRGFYSASLLAYTDGISNALF